VASASLAGSRKLRARVATCRAHTALWPGIFRISDLGRLLAKSSSSMSGSSKPSSSKVLLVDADFRTSQRLAELLGEDGFEVEVARDGAAALARLARPPLPGTLITELSIPLADGSTIARYARTQDPALRVIVLTRHPHLLSPASFSQPTPVVLTKPLDYGRLLELLRSGGDGGEESAVLQASPRN
jgi:CheY-like chemotaxis protein